MPFQRVTRHLRRGPRSAGGLSPAGLGLRSALVALAAFALLAAVPATAQPADADPPVDTLIHVGRLIDGVGESAREKVTISIGGSKILGVEDGFETASDGVRVIDLRQSTVMPGWIDLHTHLTNEGSKDSYVEGFRLNEGDYAIRGVVYAERTLMAGFTTVRDVGDRYNLSVALRRAINSGFIAGPRIFTATKSLATTGGHADPTNGVRANLLMDPGPKQGVVNSLDDAKKAVRQRYKEGADLIKITATGGVLSFAAKGQNPQFEEEEIRAIVEMANDYGFHVAAHAHGTEGMKRAIRAGVKTIEHGTYLDDEGMELMKQNGTYLVPTLMAGDHVASKAAIEGYYPEIVRRKAAVIGPVMASTFSKAYAAGVNIAFGTDSGVSPHGKNAKEFELMVAGGMPPMVAIQSATRVAAEVLGESERFGTVEAGKLADLVAVDGNPLEDISVVHQVSFVMKEGKVYKGDDPRGRP